MAIKLNTSPSGNSSLLSSDEKSPYVSFSKGGYGFDDILTEKGILQAIVTQLCYPRLDTSSQDVADHKYVSPFRVVYPSNLQSVFTEEGDDDSTNNSKLDQTTTSSSIDWRYYTKTETDDTPPLEEGFWETYNFRDTETTPTDDEDKQFVIILQTTGHLQPDKDSVMGIPQDYCIRLEWDMRKRVKVFESQLETVYGVKTNVDDDDLKLTRPDGTFSTISNMDDDNNVNIALKEVDNPSYGWLKVNIVTPTQLILDNNGNLTGATTGQDTSIVSSISLGDSLVQMRSAVARTPGELVDISEIETAISKTVPVNGVDTIKNIRVREKRKGGGFFSRVVYEEVRDGTDNNADWQRIKTLKRPGTNPMSYRITVSPQGFFLAIYEPDNFDEYGNHAWVCAQRLIDTNTSKDPVTTRKFPVHCMYSCSRDVINMNRIPMFFDNQFPDLTGLESSPMDVYDIYGVRYSNRDILAMNDYQIISREDRELRKVAPDLSKKIYRFVVRETDVLKPSEIHFDATRHEIDSNAVVNPLEQISVTPDNSYVLTFPTGFTTQRFVYMAQEMDMIAFSSAEIVSDSSVITVTDYKGLYTTQLNGQTVDTDPFSSSRKYLGLFSTLPNGNGMRLLVQTTGGYIPNKSEHTDYS